MSWDTYSWGRCFRATQIFIPPKRVYSGDVGVVSVASIPFHVRRLHCSALEHSDSVGLIRYHQRLIVTLWEPYSL